MPITKISIENFKGISERVEIPIAPITLLFGANSAGKSTILQALLYLEELLTRKNVDADQLMVSGSTIDLGGFRQLIHAHDLSREVRIGVSVSVDADGLPTGPQKFANAYDEETVRSEGTLHGIAEVGVELVLSWIEDTGKAWITEYWVTFNGQNVAALSALPEESATISFFDLMHPAFVSHDEEDEDGMPNFYLDTLLSHLLVELDQTGKDNAPTRSVPTLSDIVPLDRIGLDFPHDDTLQMASEEFALVRYVLDQVFFGAGSLVLEELQKIRHIGSFRSIPERHFRARRSPGPDRWSNGAAAWDLLDGGNLEWFDFDAFNKLELGYRLEPFHYVELPLGGAIASSLSVMYRDDDFLLEEDRRAMEEEFDSLHALQRMQLIDVRNRVEVNPVDVGVGVSQVIPVVVGAMAPGYRILSVEQPELHTHPAVQCALADLLAKTVLKSPDRVMLLETHSEHLMLRWLRRIRERNEGELPPGAPEIKPEDLSVLYVENDSRGQRITAIPVTKEGEFAKHWPKGFFEERAQELF